VLISNTEARYPSRGRCPTSKILFASAKSFKYDRVSFGSAVGTSTSVILISSLEYPDSSAMISAV